MPIDYSNYPDNWKTEIRPRILKRSQDHCEMCGLTNHSVIARHCDAPWRYIRLDPRTERLDHWIRAWRELDRIHAFEVNKPHTVVLTIAHLDQDLNNNEDDNLAALCQRCHLRHDAFVRKFMKKLQSDNEGTQP